MSKCQDSRHTPLMENKAGTPLMPVFRRMRQEVCFEFETASTEWCQTRAAKSPLFLYFCIFNHCQHVESVSNAPLEISSPAKGKDERNACVITVPVFMGPLLIPMLLLVFLMCWLTIFIKGALVLFLSYRWGNWGMETRVLLGLAVITPRTPCLGNSDSRAYRPGS